MPERNIATVLEEFGQPVAVFRPDSVALIVGIVFGLGIAGAGGAILYDAITTQTSVITTWAAGLVFLAAGLAIAWFCKSLFKFRILVCPNGLVRDVAGEIFCCRWDEIAKVTQIVSQEHLPLKGAAKNLVPVGKSNSYKVSKKDGTDLFFDRSVVRGPRRLAEMIRQETDKRKIPWNTVNE
jgi:hypothetical protein